MSKKEGRERGVGWAQGSAWTGSWELGSVGSWSWALGREAPRVALYQAVIS